MAYGEYPVSSTDRNHMMKSYYREFMRPDLYSPMCKRALRQKLNCTRAGCGKSRTVDSGMEVYRCDSGSQPFTNDLFDLFGIERFVSQQIVGE